MNERDGDFIDFADESNGEVCIVDGGEITLWDCDCPECASLRDDLECEEDEFNTTGIDRDYDPALWRGGDDGYTRDDKPWFGTPSNDNETYTRQ